MGWHHPRPRRDRVPPARKLSFDQGALRGALIRLLDDSDVARRVIETAGSLVGGDDDVFEPHPEPAGKVDAGLDGECVAGGQDLVAAGNEVGLFVFLETDAVTRDPCLQVPVEIYVGSAIVKQSPSA